jgi:multidrug efflux pump subunit AcrB
MTTLAAILTLFPLALAIGDGSAMQQPLAVAIIAGLVLQFPMVVLALPACCLRLSQLRSSQARVLAVGAIILDNRFYRE